MTKGQTNGISHSEIPSQWRYWFSASADNDGMVEYSKSDEDSRVVVWLDWENKHHACDHFLRLLLWDGEMARTPQKYDPKSRFQVREHCRPRSCYECDVHHICPKHFIALGDIGSSWGGMSEAYSGGYFKDEWLRYRMCDHSFGF